MSRAAVFDALTSDDDLNDLGITEDSVFHNYSLEERPISTGPFIILRWGEENAPLWGTVRSYTPLDIWVNYPKETTNDFGLLIAILDQIDSVFDALGDEEGSDDYTLSFIRPLGRSGDRNDDGFNTIVKVGYYQVYSRKSVSV